MDVAAEVAAAGRSQLAAGFAAAEAVARPLAAAGAWLAVCSASFCAALREAESAGRFARALRLRCKRAAAIAGDVADVARFVGQERRVRREDAVLGRERDQLVHQFLVAAFEVELVDDVADAARGPELGDEGVRVVVALVDELGGEVERLFVVADFAAELHLGSPLVR